MDGKFCYCFENIDKHNPSCQKGHQSVGLFHLLSEYCLEPFQCYSYRFETPNTDACVKCSAKLRSVCTSSNGNPNITHHCNDTKKDSIIQDKRTRQKSGQHSLDIYRRRLPYPVKERKYRRRTTLLVGGIQKFHRKNGQTLCNYKYLSVGNED